jgi:hypothetical protein
LAGNHIFFLSFSISFNSYEANGADNQRA